MIYTKKTLPQSQVELTVTVAPSDYQKHLLKAAEKISERAAIHGFRPGKAPYDIVKREVGEMKILQEALSAIVQESFYQTVTEEKLDTIGMPDIKAQKVAPGNDLVYTATVALLPTVTLPPLSEITVERKPTPVTDAQLDEVTTNLRKLQAKEVLKTGPAEAADIALIDMNMFLGGVPVEGGEARDYRVYLSENHYIPGFNQELIGLKKDDEKKFTIKFPDSHYQRHLAGRQVEVGVKVKEIYNRELPELNEEFARTLGQDSVEKLKELLRRNLTKEAEQKADERAELAMLDELVNRSQFGELPEALIDAERRKMYYELTRDLERRGVSIEKYLDDVKKSQADLYNDFKEAAKRRAKAALISRVVAREQNIAVGDDEVEAELKTMEDVYRDDPERLEKLRHADVKGAIKNMLQNKKVIVWLKEKTVRLSDPKSTPKENK